MSLHKSRTISVLMSVFSEPLEWINEAIYSILKQSYNDFEFIIINDNPQRLELKKLLCKFSKEDDRIIIIENEENIGLTKSLNNALSLSKGKFIARMDADDIALNNRFKIQIEFLENNRNVSLVGSWTRTFEDFIKIYKYPANSKLLKANLLIGNRISHSSVMFRKEDFFKNNLYYDTDFLKAQDYELWCRASLKLKLKNISAVLVMNRTHSGQISKQGLRSQNKYADFIKLRWIEYLDLNFNETENNVYLKFLNDKKLNNKELLLLPEILKNIKQANDAIRIFDKIYLQMVFFKKIIRLLLNIQSNNIVLKLKMLFIFFNRIIL